MPISAKLHLNVFVSWAHCSSYSCLPRIHALGFFVFCSQIMYIIPSLMSPHPRSSMPIFPHLISSRFCGNCTRIDTSRHVCHVINTRRKKRETKQRRKNKLESNILSEESEWSRKMLPSKRETRSSRDLSAYPENNIPHTALSFSLTYTHPP